ncbi:hypothetical protein [Micromonospora chersina]|uniref:hypothetical protein n=1 Tax=Micromonospora chersina TaxID=47854 RepID=UPI00371CDA8D
MQLADRAAVIGAEEPAAVDQDPQQGELFVVSQRVQAGHPGADQRHEVGPGTARTLDRPVSGASGATSNASRRRLIIGYLGALTWWAAGSPRG